MFFFLKKNLIKRWKEMQDLRATNNLTTRITYLIGGWHIRKSLNKFCNPFRDIFSRISIPLRSMGLTLKRAGIASEGKKTAYLLLSRPPRPAPRQFFLILTT